MKSINMKKITIITNHKKLTCSKTLIKTSIKVYKIPFKQLNFNTNFIKTAKFINITNLD